MISSQLEYKIYRSTLSNKIVLLVTANPNCNIVATKIFVRAGSSYESRDKAGLTHLLSEVITKGCEGLSSFNIAEQVESLGASLRTHAHSDYFLLSLKNITSDFPEILYLAGKILRSPTFAKSEVELEKRLILENIRSQKEQPFNIALDQLRKVMYCHHPYGLSILGEDVSVKNLKNTDLFYFHQQYFRPDNIVISISGQIDPHHAKTVIEEVFGDWQIPNTELSTALNLSKISVFPQQVITPQDTHQSIIMLGYLGASVYSPDYAALKILSTYLGNGISSRLFVELREKQGLAYEVSAFYPTRMFPASFIVYMGTAPENTEKALSRMQKEVELLSRNGLSIASLQTSKNKILGQYALGKQTNAQIAQVYGWYEIMGLGIDFDQLFQEVILRVSIEDTIKIARKYLQNAYISLVGQKTTAENILK
ncbi:Insulinase-like:Peptidase M16, C-terminal [Richelia intracellularis HH01]|jgi:predicted Zn-dependent peptidase|uniref:Insulinase-like:Peptidase M16, C-terminal n=1 Tax=Richelia intracellularis HH01 TaxID=1165094 RepID=M1WTC9_9NOST|nr:pitrilysin family protein [Richelia intracellularis]CCH68014.1 Insulinase-like:Peptidase M16, C-terminal [Richelia intracellularis HH01]HAE05753.1 insulinase family protein [Richelia sp.]